MVGRTPEYLGKKNRRPRSQACGNCPAHASDSWSCFPLAFSRQRNGALRRKAIPARMVFRKFVYQFSSASANNGSAFDGLGVTMDLATTQVQRPSPRLGHRDRLVMLFGTLSSHYRDDRHGRFSWREKNRPLRLGNASR